MNDTQHEESHIIERIRFELEYPHQDTAYQVQTELFSLFHAQLERLAADVLDQIEQEIGPMRLDRLYIDIGSLDAENWQEELVRRFPKALAEAFHQYNRELVVQGKKKDQEGLNTTSRLDLFMYYLAFGSLPWWASKKRLNLKPLLRDLLNEQGRELVSALKQQAHHQAVAQRFAGLIPSEEFGRTIQTLLPSDAAFILEFVDAVIRVNNQRPIAQRSQADFAQQVRQLVIIDLLLNHGTSFNRKMFVKRQIGSMAKAFGKSYTEILALLSEGIKGVQVPFSLRHALPVLIAQIQEEEQVPAHFESAVASAPAIEIFDDFLQNKTREGFTAQQLSGLIASEPSEVLRILKKHRPEDYVRSRLLIPLGSEIIPVLVDLLAPEQQGFIERYTEQLFFIHKKKEQFSLSVSAYEMLVWEVILIDLIKEYSSVFNRRTFIERTLKKMAEGLGVDFQVFLASFLKALDGVKLPVRFDESIVRIIQTIGEQRSTRSAQKSDKFDLNWLGQVLTSSTALLKKRFNTVWEKEILDHPKGLLQLIVSVGNTEKGRTTLLSVLSENQLVDLVELMEPENASTILNHKLAIDQWHAREKIVEASTTDFSKAQWWIVLNYLLDHRGTRFNQKSFLKNLVTQVARRFGTTYGAVIMQLGSHVIDKHGFGGIKSDFISLIQELREEEVKSKTLRESAFKSNPVMSSEEEYRLLLLYLKKGRLPWDLTLTYPDFNPQELIGQLITRKAGFWQSVQQSESVIEEEVLLKLIELAGLDKIEILVEGLMLFKHGVSPAKPFLQSMQEMAPGQERFLMAYYAQVLLNISQGNTIDFEALAQQDRPLEEPEKLEQKESYNEEEQLSSIFLQHLIQPSSVKSGPSFVVTVEKLLRYPDQLRKLISQLSAGQLKQLVMNLEVTLLVQLAKVLFRHYEAILELIKAFEGLAKADAGLIAQVTLKRHWMAVFVKVSWSTPKQGDDKWMGTWWGSLIELTKLSADRQRNLAAALAKRFSKPLNKRFLKITSEVNKGSDEHPEGLIDLDAHVLKLIRNTKTLLKIEKGRWSQLEAQWRVFIQKAPQKAFQLLEESSSDTSLFAHWATSFSDFTLEMMWRTLSPQYAHKALVLAKEMQMLLIQSQLIRFSTPDSKQVLWTWLFDYWKAGRMDRFDESKFVKTFLLHLKQYAEVPADLEKAFKNALHSSSLSQTKKTNLLKLVEADETKNSVLTEPVDEDGSEKELQQDQSAMYVGNAGLVLLWPYFQRLFSRMELVKDGKFVSEELQKKAIWVTQFLVNGRTDELEYELTLNKLLCGWPLAKPLITGIELTTAEQELCDSLVQASVANWKALGSTSVQGFRESFIQRKGKLGKGEARWELTVETKSFDVLLDTIPWGFKTVRLPWMDDLLDVDWR